MSGQDPRSYKQLKATKLTLIGILYTARRLTTRLLMLNQINKVLDVDRGYMLSAL